MLFKRHNAELFALQLLLFAIILNSANCIKNDTLNRVKRIVGGIPAQIPPTDDPVVFTRAYGRFSRIEGFRNNRTGIYHFHGIYYAEPPVGPNRYARPIYKRLQGDVDGRIHGPPCLQPDPYNQRRIIGSENCLCLNIFTPRMPDETPGLPVFVWIHPGGFRFGSAAQYDATPIARENVIVVAPNYRLGSLGIMGDGSKQFDGNLAMFDLETALRWVNDYISYFGGDPKRITAIGQGSGAASAMYLSSSQSARSASEISSVVAMSGTPLSPHAIDKQPAQSVSEIAKINGCEMKNELEIIKCLRKKSAEEIIQNDSNVQNERLNGRSAVKAIGGGLGFQPHFEYENDQRSLPSLMDYDFEQQLTKPDFMPIPLLTGTLKHETSNGKLINDLIKHYGSVDDLLHSVTEPLNELIGSLNVKNATAQISQTFLPGLQTVLTPSLGKVSTISQSLPLEKIVSQVIESTTDVFFNLPALITTQLWSKLAPSFMYSFEHGGNKSRGINFLRGLPVIANDNGTNNMKPAHGDEIGYMFDANDLFGKPLPETRLTDRNDLKVRKNIINMLVQFTSIKKGTSSFGKLFQSFTGENSPVIKIGTSLESGTGFSLCGLSMIGALPNPLGSASCSGLNSLVGTVTNPTKGLSDVLGQPSVNKVTNILGLG